MPLRSELHVMFYVAALLGPALLVWGLTKLGLGLYRRRHWVRAEAAISTWEHSLRTSNPVVEWTTRDGQRFERTLIAWDLGWYPTGPVKLWHHPRKPERVSVQLISFLPSGVITLVCSVPLLFLTRALWPVLFRA